jgi:hypothetical protein
MKIYPITPPSFTAGDAALYRPPGFFDENVRRDHSMFSRIYWNTAVVVLDAVGGGCEYRVQMHDGKRYTFAREALWPVGTPDPFDPT